MMDESKLNACVQVLETAFSRYDPSELFLSFNGGKDCTVLLDIVVRLLKVKGLKPDVISYVYVQPENPFEEMEEFVKECESLYQIKMDLLRGGIKKALTQVLERNPNLKACLMGQRRTDPYCSRLSYFEQTDSDWPSLIRINPLLDWSCKDVWDHLLSKKVNYCSLYDKGYTSIGDRSNTKPNPFLQSTDESGNISYKPAYELMDDSKERAGRL